MKPTLNKRLYSIRTHLFLEYLEYFAGLELLYRAKPMQLSLSTLPQRRFRMLQLRLNSCIAALLMTITLAWSAHSQQRLVAYWSFDSMVGDTFKDISGNGYNAIVSGIGVGQTSGLKGNAVECPINGGYDISVTNSVNSFVMNHFSIEAWVSMDTVLTYNQQHILNFQNSYSTSHNGVRPIS